MLTARGAPAIAKANEYNHAGQAEDVERDIRRGDKRSNCEHRKHAPRHDADFVPDYCQKGINAPAPGLSEID